MPVIEGVIRDWPEIKAPRLTEMLRDEHGYQGSVDLVRRKVSTLRPREERAAQRTGYRPGQVVQFDWGEMPTRPRIAGVERRVYALVASLPFCGAQTAHFSFDMTIESFLEGHVRVFDWLGGVPRECVYDNLRTAVAKRDSRQVIRWNQRFLHLRGHYAFHSTACTPQTPREKGSVEGAVRYLKTGFWPARRFQTLSELDRVYGDWRDRVAHRRRHATQQFIVADRLIEDRAGLRALPPTAFDFSLCRTVRVPADCYLRHGACFYRAPVELVHQRVELHASRDEVWICWRGEELVRYPRSYRPGVWIPEPRMRPEPPPPPTQAVISPARVDAPGLSDYAELCA
jgi:transposase